MTRLEILARTQELIGYQFKDQELLEKALTHASIAESRLDSNERLEFLGDSVLAAVVCSELFACHENFLEGELTKLKSVIVSRKTCAQISDRLGLTPLLFLGKGMGNHDTVPTSLRAAVLESVIGGIFLDGGFDEAKRFILENAGDYITQKDEDHKQRNHKSLLQQHVQKHMAATPQYIQLDEQGPDHSKCFNVCVLIGSRRFSPAWGPSKKEAEQKAAENALAEILQSE